MTKPTTLELADTLRALRLNLQSAARLMQKGKSSVFAVAASNVLQRFGRVENDGTLDAALAASLCDLWNRIEVQSALLERGERALHVERADNLLARFEGEHGWVPDAVGGPTKEELFNALLAAKASFPKDGSPAALNQIDGVIRRYETARADRAVETTTSLQHLQGLVQEAAPKIEYALLLATHRAVMLRGQPDARLGETAAPGLPGDDLATAARKLGEASEGLATLKAAVGAAA